ncbi:hypothetical protein [uncultured Pseudokineococcus sp.]|uniref:hypothetical protein n=1 Tax=uncultured Pseudokineococcus sp. TaxID=1642928 RepID=UPI00260AC156|nr:hypothetical protein [uncultured Pseudokineococcus sp.]
MSRPQHRPVDRPGRRPSRAVRACAAVLLAGLAAGCASEQPLPPPRPQEVGAPVPAVDAEQLEQVHADVAETVAGADAARDATLLDPLVTGAAAEVRAARYRLQELVPDAPAPVPVEADALRDVVPAVGVPGAEEGEAPERAPSPADAAATFPRTWATITGPQAQPQLAVLVQEDVRSPYRVVTTTGLLPGAVVPPVATAEQGAPPVDPASAEGLVLSPQDAVARYAEALSAGDPAAPTDGATDDGAADDEATDDGADQPDAEEQGPGPDVVADDAFRAEVRAERAEADAVDFFALETTRTPRPDAVRAVATADGGALVVGVLDSSAVQVVEEEGAVLQLPETVAALAGRDDAPERLEQKWVEVVALVVPPADEPGPVRAVGADRVLVEATAS